MVFPDGGGKMFEEFGGDFAAEPGEQAFGFLRGGFVVAVVVAGFFYLGVVPVGATVISVGRPIASGPSGRSE